MDTDITIYTSAAAYKSQIHFYHLIVNTNTNIYNNQQQQQEGKEIGKKCY